MQANYPWTSECLPPKTLLCLLQSLLTQISTTLTLHIPTLPLRNYREQLNPLNLQYQLIPLQNFILNTGTLAKFVRLLELMRAVMVGLEQGTILTKRSLYYRLASYYHDYAVIDGDLRLVCYNLWAEYLRQNGNNLDTAGVRSICKNDLGVIASNRCIIYGNITITADGKVISQSKPKFDASNQMITIPTCQKISAELPKSPPAKILLIQKQSIFYSLVETFRQHLPPSHNYILMTAKGYPDYNTRSILAQIAQQDIDRVYYLGDFDVYGFDIFMFYAFGDWTCPGILPWVDYVQLANYVTDGRFFEGGVLDSEMGVFNDQDFKKIKELQKKFQDIQSKIQQFDIKIQDKVIKIHQYFKKFITNQKKCQLQLLFQNSTNKLWVHQIVKQMGQNK